MVWTLFGPMPQALSFKDLGFAIGLPWRVASIWACLVSPFLPFLGLDLPLLSSVIKGIGGCLDHLIKRGSRVLQL